MPCVWHFLCRNILLEYDKVLLRINEVQDIKVLITIKRHVFSCRPALTSEKWFFVEVFNMISYKCGLSAWRRDVHLMHALNAPKGHYHQTKIKWRIQSLWDNKYLKMKAINTGSFEEEDTNPMRIHSFHPFYKRFFVYCCKVQNLLKHLEHIERKD